MQINHPDVESLWSSQIEAIYRPGEKPLNLYGYGCHLDERHLLKPGTTSTSAALRPSKNKDKSEKISPLCQLTLE
ncbi:predicted protein [Sclerotinia sclerotiorum 1980 UF-70]|uniref:Uncharacterized protein n=2 Tax=Sclerotinia sclerotiorum (strain ATCC 18683 / 1980 / Ss-1) TaxID=665079 RepID=A7EZS9_SCLS1|nr:predicted protein [Sclerotinia sclerotiorum 1980 UF-70]APA12173.1 hypothetical protein sscle_09g069430 [Sclerotinia sclerotiorum 1980 UF-70]EDN94971.1 predicted protein [Sclerotinia sclerotiorum 1980 UF-70]